MIGKTKWTAIPAAELLAAADEAAETQRRVAREQAARRKGPINPGVGVGAGAGHPSGSSGPGGESSFSQYNNKPLRKKSIDSRRGRMARSGSGSEVRLPPNPFPRRMSGGEGVGMGGSAAVKSAFGSVRPVGAESGDASHVRGETDMGPVSVGMGISDKGGFSEPISRQTSGSRVSSPQRSRTQLPSPVKQREGDMMGLQADMAGPHAHGAGQGGSHTAPIMQLGFPGPGVSRAGRGPRQSFSGSNRGRGGYRGGYKAGGLGMGVGMGMGMGGGMGGETGSFPSAAGGGGGSAFGRGGYTPFVPQHQLQQAAGHVGKEGSHQGSPPTGYEPAIGGVSNGGYAAWDPMQGYGMAGMSSMGMQVPMFGTPRQGSGQLQGQGQGQAQTQSLPMPPPPMPITHAQGLDSLRFYVLGQVSLWWT